MLPAIWILLGILLVGVVANLMHLLTSRRGPEGVGLFTMTIGAIGIVVPLFVLMGDSSRDVQLAVLISGAIVFGCGAIAVAIGKRKQPVESADADRSTKALDEEPSRSP